MTPRFMHSACTRLILLSACLGVAASSMAAPKATTTTDAVSAVSTASPVLVRVNGVAIPQSRLQTALATAGARGIEDSPQLRDVLRAELITQELLRQAALKKKLDRDPAVIAARDVATKTAMIQRYLALSLKPQAVSDADVEKRYETIVATLGDTEYKARVLAVGSETEARQVLAKVRSKELTFETAARQFSLLPSQANGGELDWLSFKLPATEGNTQGIPPTLVNALVSLPVGGITADPVALEGRYFLLQLDHSRPTRIPALADAAAGIRRALEAQELERAAAVLVKGLISSAHVE